MYTTKVSFFEMIKWPSASTDDPVQSYVNLTKSAKLTLVMLVIYQNNWLLEVIISRLDNVIQHFEGQNTKRHVNYIERYSPEIPDQKKET